MALDTRWKNPQGADPRTLYLWAQDLIRELRKGDFFSTQVGSGITNAQLADMAAGTIKMRNAVTAGDPQDVLISDLDIDPDPTDANDYLLGAEIGTDELRRFPVRQVGGLQLLNSGTVSNAATLDIVLTGFTGYRALKLVLTQFVPASDDVELWLRTSSNGGVSYDAGASDYAWSLMRVRSGTSGASGDVAGADSEIVLAGANAATFSVSNVANEGGANVEVTLWGQTQAAFGRVSSSGGFHAAAGDTVLVQSYGERLSAADVDAVRVLFESGNTSSGNWALYGYA